MGTINMEEVVGFWIDWHANKLICRECAEKMEDLRKLQEYQPVFAEDLAEDAIYFCECHGRKLE